MVRPRDQPHRPGLMFVRAGIVVLVAIGWCGRLNGEEWPGDGTASRSQDRRKVRTNVLRPLPQEESDYDLGSLVEQFQRRFDVSEDEARSNWRTILTDQDRQVVSSEGSIFRVCAPAARHDEIRKALSLWQRDGVQRMPVRMTVYSLPEAAFCELPATWQDLTLCQTANAQLTTPGNRLDANRFWSGPPGKQMPGFWCRLEPHESVEFRRSFLRLAGAECLARTEFTLTNGLVSRINLLHPRRLTVSYVPDGDGDLQPEREELPEGLTVLATFDRGIEESVVLNCRVHLFAILHVFHFSLPEPVPNRSPDAVPSADSFARSATPWLPQTRLLPEDSTQLLLEQPVWQSAFSDASLLIRPGEQIVIGGLTKRETGREACEILVVFETLR